MYRHYRGVRLHRAVHDDDALDALVHRYEQGLVEALHLAADPQDGREVPVALKFVASYMLKVIYMINHVRNSFHPHLQVRCPNYLIMAA
jgi:hypothetical protein